MDEIEEITRGILGPRASSSEATENEIRSLGVVLALHRHLRARGWRFESVYDLVIWTWPPSRISDDAAEIASTNLWVDIEQVEDGPERMDLHLSLVGEPNTYADEWTQCYPIVDPFEALPLDQAEAYRFREPLPAPWSLPLRRS